MHNTRNSFLWSMLQSIIVACCICVARNVSAKPHQHRSLLPQAHEEGLQTVAGSRLEDIAINQCERAFSLERHKPNVSQCGDTINVIAGEFVLFEHHCPQNDMTIFSLASNSTVFLRDGSGPVTINAIPSAVELQNVLICIRNFTWRLLGESVGNAGASAISLVSFRATSVQNVTIVIDQAAVLAPPLLSASQITSSIGHVLSSIVVVHGDTLAQDVRVIVRNLSVAPATDSSGLQPQSLTFDVSELPIALSSLFVVSSSTRIDGAYFRIVHCSVHVKTSTPGATFLAVVTLNSTTSAQVLSNVDVQLVNSTVEWHIDPNLTAKVRQSNLERFANSFDMSEATSGIIVIATAGVISKSNSADSNLIRNVSVEAINGSFVVWLHGTFPAGSTFPDINHDCPLCSVRPTFIGVYGQRFAHGTISTADTLRLHAVDSSFFARGSCVTVIILDYLARAENVDALILRTLDNRNTKRQVAEIGGQHYDIALLSQTAYSTVWNVLFVNAIRVEEVILSGVTMIVCGVAMYLTAISGELPGANSTALTVISATAISLGFVSNALVATENVTISSNIENGTIQRLRRDTSSDAIAVPGLEALPLSLTTIAMAFISVLPLATASDLHLRVTRCSLEAAVNVTINVTDLVFLGQLIKATGVVSLEVAAVMMGCTTQGTIVLDVGDTSVEVAKTWMFRKMEPAATLPILEFVSIVSLHTPLSIAQTLVRTWTTPLDQIRLLLSSMVKFPDAEALTNVSEFLPKVGNLKNADVKLHNVSVVMAFEITEASLVFSNYHVPALNASIFFVGAVVVDSVFIVETARIVNASSAILPQTLFSLLSTATNAPRSIFSFVVHSTTSLWNCFLFVKGTPFQSALGNSDNHAVLLQTVLLQISGVLGVVYPLVSFHASTLCIWEQTVMIPLSTTAAAMRRHVGGGVAVVLVRAWPNNNSVVFENSTVILSESNYSGSVDRLFGSDAHLLDVDYGTVSGDGGKKSFGAATSWVNGSQLMLGCNVWNGDLFPNALSPWQVLDDVPIWARAYSSFEHLCTLLPLNVCDSLPRFVGCAPPDHLFSMTTTDALSQSHPMLLAPITPLTLPTISPNTAILSLAALDSVFLIALGQSSCGPAEMKKATSNTRFLLSPFYDYGGDVAAIGNLGLILIVASIHTGRVAWIRRKRQKEKGQLQREESTFSGIASPKGILWFLINGESAKRNQPNNWLPDAAAAQFPNLTIVALTYALNGICFASANAVTIGAMGSAFADDDDDSLLWLSIVCGSVAMLCVVALIIWYLVTVMADPRHGVLKRFRFERYPLHIRRLSSTPAFLLPYGRWGPDQWRSSFGKLRSLARPGKTSEKLAMLPILVACISSMVLGVSGSEDIWCPIQWTILCLMSLSAAAIILVVRPTRIPVVNVFLFLQYALQFHVYLLGALVQLNLGSSRGAVVTLLMAISTLLTLLSIVKTIHAVGIFFWERKQNPVMSKMKVEQIAAFQPKEWHESNPQDDSSRCIIDDLQSLHPLFLKETNRQLRENVTKQQQDRGNTSAVTGVGSAKKEVAYRSVSSLASSMATRFSPPDLQLPYGVVTSSCGHSLTLSSSFVFAWQSRQPKNAADQLVALEGLIDSICTRARAVQRES